MRVCLSVIAVCLVGSSVAAQAVPSNGDLLRLIETQQRVIDEQGRRLDALQRQLDDLRGQTVTPTVNRQPQGSPDADPRGQRPEAPPDLVRSGDFPGSLTIPGSDAAFKLGGLVRVNWVSTLDPLLVEDRFITADIPIDVTNAPIGGRVEVMAIPSRFNLDLRTQTGVGYMRAYLEADFAGSGNTLRLRHAYGQWRRLLFGQTWSTFADPESEPDGIDFEGLNAIVRFRQPQVRWSWAAAEHLRVAFALEQPGTEIAGLTAANERPDLVARIRWEPVTDRHLQAAVLYRDLRGFPSNAPQHVVGATGWGATVSGRWPSPAWRTHDEMLFQLNAGAGIGRYVTDLSAAGGQDGVYDAINSRIHPLRAASGHAGYEHWWTGRLHSAFTVGAVAVRNDGFQPGDAYYLTRRSSANVIWSPITRLDLVTEFLSGTRVNRNRHRAQANQIQIGSTFRF